MSFTLRPPTSRHHSRMGMTRATDKHRHRVTTSPLQRTHSPIPHLKDQARRAATRPHPKLQKPQHMPTSSSIVVPLLVPWSHQVVQPYDLRRAIRPLVSPSSALSRTLTQRAASPRMNLSCSTGLCPPTTRGTNPCPPSKRGKNDHPTRQPRQRRPGLLFPRRRRRSLGYTLKRFNTL